MDETQPAGGRRRTTAIIAAAGLACLAIAIPVSGAFGAGEGKDAAATQSQQQRGQGYGPQGYGGPPPGDHGRRGDCPKHRNGSQPQGGGQNQGTYAPGTPGDYSVEL